MEGVLVLLFVTAVVMLFFARKAVNRAFTQSFELPPFRAKSDRLPPLSRGNPEGSAERREELRAKAKERVADLIQNPEKYGARDKSKIRWSNPVDVFIGPRGGRYRINSKGRKSCDV